MRSERLFKKRRKRIIIRTILVVLALVVVIATPALLSRIPAFRIQIIDVKTDGVMSQDAIRTSVEDTISGYYAYIFLKSNIFIYPKQKITEALLVQFPRIETISVGMSGITSIDIQIIERKPEALWCQNEQDCYFIDRDGLIFDRASSFTDTVYVVFSDTVKNGPIGSQFLNQDEFRKVNEVISGVKALSLVPVSLASLGDNEYSMGLVAGEYIFFTTRDSIAHTVSNLESILSDPKLSLRQDDGLSVSTLDVR